MLVRVMIGGRIAHRSSPSSRPPIALVIGVAWGAIAAYAGGRIDYVMMRVVDALYGFPTVVFVIVVMAVFDTKNLVVLFALIGSISWLNMARQTRGQVLSLRHREFVEAARAVGARPARILFRHIVPNALGVIIVAATASLPHGDAHRGLPVVPRARRTSAAGVVGDVGLRGLLARSRSTPGSSSPPAS